MNKCRHEWIKILPMAGSLPIEKQADYLVAKGFTGTFSGVVFCPKCGYTGHKIKSHRGGYRRHLYKPSFLLEKANKIRAEFNMPLLQVQPL